MRLVIDRKGVLWQIDKWGHYVIHSGPAPADATIIEACFNDGFTASSEEFAQSFGVKYNMRLSAQTTTYELSVADLKALVAKELNVVDEQKIRIEFMTKEVGDDRFGPTSRETIGVKVHVDGPLPTTGE